MQNLLKCRIAGEGEDDKSLPGNTESSVNYNLTQTGPMGGALILNPVNLLLEHGQTFLKLLKRLKGALEDDVRDYGLVELFSDIVAYDKKYKMNGALHKSLRDGFGVLTDCRSFSPAEFAIFTKQLQNYIALFQKAFSDCILSISRDAPEISKDTGDLTSGDYWRFSREAITIITFALKSLFVEGGSCLVKSVRSRILPVLDVSFDVLSRALSLRYPPESLGFTVEAKMEGFSAESEISQITILLDSLTHVPVSDVDAITLELSVLLQNIKQHTKFIRSIGGASSVSAPVDSSSEDEMVLTAEESSAVNLATSGLDLSAAEFAVIAGARSMCKLTISVIEDLLRFIKDQYQFDQNLCWNCYGTYWLEGVARVSRGIADQIEDLASVVAPPQRAELVVRSVRFLRVHIKALLDLAAGHDQFQECEIPSARETFKSGHYWNHKMVRRLQSSFDSIMLQLYRMGI